MIKNTAALSEHRHVRAATARMARFKSMGMWPEALDQLRLMKLAQAAVLRARADALEEETVHLTVTDVMPKETQK